MDKNIFSMHTVLFISIETDSQKRTILRVGEWKKCKVKHQNFDQIIFSKKLAHDYLEISS
jgi:hypothetical protein